MLLASLPWYDLEEIRWATDELWRQLRQHLRRAGLNDVPERLNRQLYYEEQWKSQRFLFGQACGYDVRISHARRLRVVATPRYAVRGCRGCYYSSLVLIRADSPVRELADLHGKRCVINTPTSHSGMNVLRSLVAPLHSNGRFFSEVKVSGSHESSLGMVLGGEVDIAAIDCVTHALLKRHRPQALQETRVLCQTEHVAAPPYVTSTSTSAGDLALLRVALKEVLDRPEMSKTKAALCLDDVDFLPGTAYQRIEDLESFARRLGYRELPGDSHRPTTEGRLPTLIPR